jgi:hypothetical protein
MIAKTSILCHILQMLGLGMFWTILIHSLQGTPGVSVLVYRWMIFNLAALIVLRTLTRQFS